jgi:uncharacterized protein YlaI
MPLQRKDCARGHRCSAADFSSTAPDKGACGQGTCHGCRYGCTRARSPEVAALSPSSSGFAARLRPAACEGPQAPMYKRCCTPTNPTRQLSMRSVPCLVGAMCPKCEHFGRRNGTKRRVRSEFLFHPGLMRAQSTRDAVQVIFTSFRSSALEMQHDACTLQLQPTSAC